MHKCPHGEPRSICESVTHSCLEKKVYIKGTGGGGAGLLSLALISVQMLLLTQVRSKGTMAFREV